LKARFKRAVAIFSLIQAGLIVADASPAPSDEPQDKTPGAHQSNGQAAAHWAFVAPRVPPIPPVDNRRWVRNPIDAFVLARLEKERIAPSPEADRRTLIRRLCLDLIGLPPTPEQLTAFLADRRPEAYERLVDALLSSPHFGERWGRHWLDLARYADTSGYQVDRPRPYAYLFRDWVINAINDDVPFDQFTIDQLAGDLLPNATLEQKTAAGFHRLTLMNHEDGTDAEEFRCKAKVDRVGTTGTVWLGLTLSCAECHNHKYDPISQREFYQLYAFFNNSQEVDVPAPHANDPARLEREKKDWDAESTRLKELLTRLTRAKDPHASEVKRQFARHRRAEPRKLDAAAESFLERTAAARAQVHVRGDFLRKGDEVAAGTPAVLPLLKPRGTAADRLDLARWLVERENPLTARVAVNHIWQHLFGRGLVNTPEDFGTRGELASHPELLDWLAVMFSSPHSDTAPTDSLSSRSDSSGGRGGPLIEGISPLPARASQGDGEMRAVPECPRNNQSDIASAVAGLGWSRKALLRLIVTSATYRQASAFRPELIHVDPQNVLLARQSRLRVESEIIRDLSLAVSALLNDDIGGASFRPFLPDDIKKLGAAGAFSWSDTEGVEKYRRGLYIFAQRTVPYPTSMAFDQADPTQSCPRRERSNTPLQALTLLNHGIFVECAQGLAKRIAALPAKSLPDRIGQAFELCVSRKPGREELLRLERLYREQTALRATNSTASAQGDNGGKTGPQSGDERALLALSQVLLNLDEFMTRE
jgi:hypothetical protein